MDELKALSLGGDDYVSKPYNISVLLACINRILQRNTQMIQEDVIEIRGLRIHVLKSSVEYNGVKEELTKMN